MIPFIRSCSFVLVFIVSILGSNAPAGAQSVSANRVDDKGPYKVMTSGNQVTVRCTRDIKTIMVWTTTGSRILEKTVQASLFSFRVPGQHKLIFLRIELADGKTYSEKIGLN